MAESEIVRQVLALPDLDELPEPRPEPVTRERLQELLRAALAHLDQYPGDHFVVIRCVERWLVGHFTSQEDHASAALLAEVLRRGR